MRRKTNGRVGERSGAVVARRVTTACVFALAAILLWPGVLRAAGVAANDTLPAVPQATCPPDGQCFADVPSGNTFYEFANRLYQQDIISGYPCGAPGEPCDSENRPYYRPVSGVTRQQMTKFVDQARRLPGIYIDTATHGQPIYSRTTVNDGRGLYGVANGGTSAAGVYGSSTTGDGVFGTTSSTDGSGYGVRGVSTASNGIGVAGQANSGSGAVGVYGATITGDGVYGLSLSSTGNGVMGRADNGSSARGVLGVSAGGYGVEGTSTSGSGVVGQTSSGDSLDAGVAGMNSAQNGTGVRGIANSGSLAVGVGGQSTEGYGVYGASLNSRGVYGWSGTGIGVRGQTESSSDADAGVEGVSTASGGTGVKGTASGALSVGVQGQSTGGLGGYFYSDTSAGVYARSTSSSGGDFYSQSGNAVHASTQSGNAGYFVGDVVVTGSCCAAGAGTYRIDHPLDPENRYLQHASVQSQDMMNIYNGNVTTDANGDAVVALPEWFEALNSDFRYQLTVIGQFAQAIVSSKVKDNRFSIKSDRPGVEVSWQVTGIRKDAYANAHRVQVEVDKPETERGKYQHPVEWGQPESKGLDYEQRQLIEQMEEQKSGK